MKLTSIDMDWTDDGARVMSTLEIACPACGITVTPNVEHLCGDRLPKEKKIRRRKANAARVPESLPAARRTKG